MDLNQLANTPCGKAVVDTHGLQELLNKLDKEGLAGKAEADLSKTARVVDGVYEFYINSLLSAPSTIAINAVSNIVPVGTRVLETLAAASYSKVNSKLWGARGSRVTYMEAMAEAQGIGEGFKEAFTFLGLRMGKKGIMDTSEKAMGKMNIPEALASQAKVERARRAIVPRCHRRCG